MHGASCRIGMGIPCFSWISTLGSMRLCDVATRKHSSVHANAKMGEAKEQNETRQLIATTPKHIVGDLRRHFNTREILVGR